MAEVCQDSEERSSGLDPRWIWAYQPGKRPVRAPNWVCSAGFVVQYHYESDFTTELISKPDQFSTLMHGKALKTNNNVFIYCISFYQQTWKKAHWF